MPDLAQVVLYRLTQKYLLIQAKQAQLLQV